MNNSMLDVRIYSHNIAILDDQPTYQFDFITNNALEMEEYILNMGSCSRYDFKIRNVGGISPKIPFGSYQGWFHGNLDIKEKRSALLFKLSWPGSL